ncbi:MAG: FHA domain-containing protein [Deltaproteobacteria bacterium]|nr:FHA domain-containing protein [Deltaproteobacteria bacterium]
MIKVLLKFKGNIVSETLIKSAIITVGRESGNDIEIDNPAVSGIHARIGMEGENVYIEDANSTNGTFLNGKKIEKEIIKTDDEVIIGKHSLSIIELDGESVKSGDEPLTPVIPSLDKTMVLDSKMQEKLMEPKGIFTLLDGPGNQKSYNLTDRVTTIGKSSDAQIRIKGFFAPKVAALINKTDKGYTLTPADKKNLPKINGSVSNEPHMLKDKDILEIGGLTLQFIVK